VDVEREWLDLVAAVLATPLTALPEERLATTLMRTLDAPACAFHGRPEGGTLFQRVYPEGLFSAAQQAEWLRLGAEEPGSHPLLRYYLRTGDRAPRQVADVPSLFTGPAVRARWVELSRCHGFEHQLAIPLSATDGPRWFVLGRDRPFTADRMELARRLQPIVVGLDRQVAALRPVLSRAPGRGPRPEDRGAPARACRVRDTRALAVAADTNLTPRELAVLTLVAEGLTAGAAARRLVVAERTVHKHLERSYAKLGVSDRVSAVLRAQRLGILPEPVPAVAP
jgi:DNA-binding CsgD family transcriptional regulator